MFDNFAVWFFIASVFLLVLATWLVTPKMKGWLGEYFVKKILIKLAIQLEGLQYHDLLIGEGEQSTQIDNLFITKKAVYVIEVKNYAGRVYGHQYQDQWSQTIRYDNKKKTRSGKVYTKTHIAKNQFFNPIKQNQIHVNAIKNMLNKRQQLPIYNIVVFMNRTNIQNITMVDDKAFLINRRHLRKTILKLEKQHQKVIEDLITVDQEVMAKNVMSKSNLKAHVRKLKKKYPKRS
jgi:hypothetical protein